MASFVKDWIHPKSTVRSSGQPRHSDWIPASVMHEQDVRFIQVKKWQYFPIDLTDLSVIWWHFLRDIFLKFLHPFERDMTHSSLSLVAPSHKKKTSLWHLLAIDEIPVEPIRGTLLIRVTFVEWIDAQIFRKFSFEQFCEIYTIPTFEIIGTPWISNSSKSIQLDAINSIVLSVSLAHSAKWISFKCLPVVESSRLNAWSVIHGHLFNLIIFNLLARRRRKLVRYVKVFTNSMWRQNSYTWHNSEICTQSKNPEYIYNWKNQCAEGIYNRERYM